jgi:phage protein U
MSLNAASTLLASATEKTRRLAGIIDAADDGDDRTDTDLSRLLASLRERELSAVSDIDGASTALSAAGDGFAVGIDNAAATARTLSSVASNLSSLANLARNISDGGGMIAAANKIQAFSNVGSAISTAVAGLRNIAGDVQQLFDATANQTPSLSPVPIESTAATPDSIARGFPASIPDSGGSNAHLLILTAMSGESYYFNINTSGYDRLKRTTAYTIATQERLTRRPALQAVAKGGETLTLSGVIITKLSGPGQIRRLRSIGYQTEPVILTTGYGESLGYWYLTKIDEEQEYLFPDGMPRKQTFTLEFERYGEDYQNV